MFFMLITTAVSAAVLVRGRLRPYKTWTRSESTPSKFGMWRLGPNNFGPGPSRHLVWTLGVDSDQVQVLDLGQVDPSVFILPRKLLILDYKFVHKSDSSRPSLKIPSYGSDKFHSFCEYVRYDYVCDSLMLCVHCF